MEISTFSGLTMSKTRPMSGPTLPSGVSDMFPSAMPIPVRPKTTVDWTSLFGRSAMPALRCPKTEALASRRLAETPDIGASMQNHSSPNEMPTEKLLTKTYHLDGSGDNCSIVEPETIAAAHPNTEEDDANQLARESAAGNVHHEPDVFEAEFADLCERSRGSNLTNQRQIRYDPHNQLPEHRSIRNTSNTDTHEHIEPNASLRLYESSVDKILQIMNTAETDYTKHRLRVTSQRSGSPNSATNMSLIPYTNNNQFTTPTDQFPVPTFNNNYSFYALFFMLLSNIVGVTLSLSFQVLLCLKLNADRFLNKSWLHCQNVSILGMENNVVVLLLMLPVILLVLVAYVTIWAAYNLNRLMLTTVPDRLAEMINFNIQIVS